MYFSLQTKDSGAATCEGLFNVILPQYWEVGGLICSGLVNNTVTKPDRSMGTPSVGWGLIVKVI